MLRWSFLVFLVFAHFIINRGVMSLPDEIALDPSTIYQTITGWEASPYCADLPGHSAAYPIYMSELFDKVVNDMGITRLRVGVGGGQENPVDYYTQWVNGQITEHEYFHNPGYAYQIVNDNDDPDVINWSGFQFSGLDHKFDDIVMPMKQLLEARGENLYINICYTDFDPSSFEHYDYPEEYAEFVLAFYQHLQNKYGVVPDAWEVILEPDNSAWSGTHIGQVIVAAANRLQAHGFSPRFIAPSTTNMGNASSYFDQIIQVPGALQYMEEISYHRYSGVSDANLQAIVQRAIQYSLNTSMLEHMGSDYPNLHQDLTMGRNSAWSGAYSIAGKSPSFDLYRIDDTDPYNPLVIMNNDAKFYRQYFKFIRPGAVRIGATSNNNVFDPVTFINNDGSYVVVVKATSGGSFNVQGLPQGTYAIKYTTPSEYDVDLAEQIINVGDTLTTSIPRDGVITIYGIGPPGPVPLSITTTSLADAIANQAYSATLAAVGGTTPYTWSIISGNLPNGLSLNANTGVISGTPTQEGTSNFTVEVQDSASPSDTDSRALSITVNPQVSNLVGHWTFDEGSGTQAADSSGNNNHGTLINGPTWTTGRIGSALSFDGIDDYVSTADIDFAAGPFTVMAWFNVNPGTNGGWIISKTSSWANINYEIYFNEQLGEFYAGMQDSAGNPNVAISSSGYAGNWHHMAMVVTTNTLGFFVDGVSMGTVTHNSNLDTNNQNTEIGAASIVSANYFDGLIDDVRIYNRALSQSEIQALANPTQSVGTLQFSINDYIVNENGTSATITVNRMDGSNGVITVDYATAEGTATAGLDYTATSGTITFADGEMGSKTYNIPILDDTLDEMDETVNLTLSSPTGGATLGNPSTAVLTITDNDETPGKPGKPMHIDDPF